MKKNITRVRLIIIITLTLTTLIVWFGYEIRQKYTEDIVPPDVKQLIQPLNSNLELQVLDELEKKQNIPIFVQKSNNPSPAQDPTEADLNFIIDGSGQQVEINTNGTIDNLPASDTTNANQNENESFQQETLVP